MGVEDRIFPELIAAVRGRLLGLALLAVAIGLPRPGAPSAARSVRAAPSRRVRRAPRASRTVIEQYCLDVPRQRQAERRSVARGVRSGEGGCSTPTSPRRSIRKLRAGMMPPPGAERPSDDAARRARRRRSKRSSTRPPSARPNPGRRTFQRLNRAEYAQVGQGPARRSTSTSTAFLPADTISHNFDNIADVQSMSADAARGLPARRGAGEPARGRRSRGERRTRRSTRCRAWRRSSRTSKGRRSARAAASRSCTTSRPTATTPSG